MDNVGALQAPAKNGILVVSLRTVAVSEEGAAGGFSCGVGPSRGFHDVDGV